VLSLSGKLGDGTAFTSALSPDREEDPGYRWFAQPYLPARTLSFIAGSFKLSPHPNVVYLRQVEEAALAWRKSGLPTDPAYRLGFGPMPMVMLLDPWQRPTTAAPLVTRLGLTSEEMNVGHTATGSAAHPGLPAVLRLNPNQTVSVLSALDAGAAPAPWKMTLNAAKGSFSGSFVLEDAGRKRTVPFSGVLRQPTVEGADLLIGDGHYLQPALPGAVTNERVSGEILLSR
jgi:hypothetical protein